MSSLLYHFAAQETHSYYRGLHLGGDTKSVHVPDEGIGHLESVPADHSDQGILDRMQKHHEYLVRTDQINTDPDNPRREHWPIYGGHWTGDHRLAKQFALDPSHGQYRVPRPPTQPTTGVVLEAQSTVPPKVDPLSSQYGETETEWPGRSKIDRVIAHVHRYDPQVHRGVHDPDTYVRSFEIPREHIERYGALQPWQQQKIEDDAQMREALHAHLREHHPEIMDQPEGARDALHRAAHTAEGRGYGQVRQPSMLDQHDHEHDPLTDPSRPYRERVTQVRRQAAWVRDENGNASAWEDDPDTLLKEALHGWVAHPSDMRYHLRRIHEGLPPEEPSSGTYKINRARAEALHAALQSAPPIPQRLYRGTEGGQSGLHPTIATSWTTRPTYAQHWARDDGTVHTLEKGQARGIRMADHIRSGLNDDLEKQWLVVAHPQGKQAAREDIDDIMDLLGPAPRPAGGDNQAQQEQERQQRAREHEEWQSKRKGYNPGDDLSDWEGYPHAEWVPIHVAQHFREHSGDQHAGSERTSDEIAEQLKAGRGMTDPLMLLHHNEKNVASLGEGNHRLRAAEKAGWTHVPMRVVRMYDAEASGNSSRMEHPPRSIPHIWRGHHVGRTPEMARPSDVFNVEGLTVLPKKYW